MNSQNPNPLLSKEELDAALAEIESLTPRRSSIPSLDEDVHHRAKPGQEVVPVPIPVPIPRMATSRAAVAEEEPETARPPAAPETSEVTAPTERSPARGAAFTQDPAVGGDSARAGLVYRVLDRVLAWIDRPFAWLGPRARATVGIVGTVTLITSLLAGYVLPRLVRPNDPVSFLHEKRAALQAASPERADTARPPQAHSTGKH